MAYYAIVTPAMVGHLNPIAVLARALQKRGHRVAFVGPADAKYKAHKAGVEFIQICGEEFPAGEWEKWTARLGELTGIKANRFAGHWLGVMARGIIRDLPQVIAREKFDGVVMDQITIGTEAVCAVTKTPLAVACCALAMNPEWGVPPVLFLWKFSHSLAARVRNCIGYFFGNLSGTTVWRAVSPYRRKHRLGMMALNHMSQLRPSLVQVSQQPAFFDFPREHLPAHFHYTGPWIEKGEQIPGPHPGPLPKGEGDGARSRPSDRLGDESFPWDRLDGRPLIYASLGTLQNRLFHAFKIIAEACSMLDAQLVLALGNKNATPSADLAGKPIVVGYAPQAALLKRASLVITHCGLNTTLETLSESLPLVGLPITNDQPGVATRVEYLGAGIKIPIKQLNVDRLRGAIQQIQSEPRFRNRARELAAQIARTDGPALAAELIETAFTTRQRVMRAKHSPVAAV